MLQKERKVRYGKKLFLLSLVFLSFVYFSSADLGFHDDTKPNLEVTELSGCNCAINYSLQNVNNSLYWQGHTGTDGSWLTGILTSTGNDGWIPMFSSDGQILINSPLDVTGEGAYIEDIGGAALLMGDNMIWQGISNNGIKMYYDDGAGYLYGNRTSYQPLWWVMGMDTLANSSQGFFPQDRILFGYSSWNTTLSDFRARVTSYYDPRKNFWNLSDDNVTAKYFSGDGRGLTNISIYNSTLNNLLNQNCPSGKVVNGTLANGTFICTAVASPFNSTNFAMWNISNNFQKNNNFTGNQTIFSGTLDFKGCDPFNDGGCDNNDGLTIFAGYNPANVNKQLWLGIRSYIGDGTKAFFRYGIFDTNIAWLSGVNGNGSTNLPIGISPFTPTYFGQLGDDGTGATIQSSSSVSTGTPASAYSADGRRGISAIQGGLTFTSGLYTGGDFYTSLVGRKMIIGSMINFTKNNYDNPSIVNDVITGDVAIARGDSQGFFNPFYQASYSGNPTFTEWAKGACSDLNFGTWFTTVSPQAYGSDVNAMMADSQCLHLTDGSNLYFIIKITAWTSGANGGGFSYNRTEVTFSPIINATQSGTTIDSNVSITGILNMNGGTIRNVTSINPLGTTLALGGTINITGNAIILGNLSVKRPYWNGYDNSTQLFLNTANVQVINISNNNDYDSYGIHVQGTQNLTFDMTGDYMCILSPEFYQASGSNKIIAFWYQKTNSTGSFVDVPWSNSRYSMGNGEYLAPAIPFQFDIAHPATDKVRFMWYSDSTASQIISIAAPTSPTRPGIPGVILNCQKVSEIT